MYKHDKIREKNKFFNDRNLILVLIAVVNICAKYRV